MKTTLASLLMLLALNVAPSIYAKTKGPKKSWDILAEYDLKTKKIGKELKGILGKTFKLSGFMIPLDYSEKNIREFLLVPYFPSCSHVPPPPGNQIVSVKVMGRKGVKAMYNPIKLTGKLTLSKDKKQNDPYMPTGVFVMNATKVEEIKNE